MTHINASLVRETTSTEGTGAYVLAGAQSSFRDFDSPLAAGDTCWAAVRMGSNYEIGLYTFSTSPFSLARTTIYESSNANNAVNWGAGVKDIYMITPPKAIQTKARESLASAATVDLGSVAGQSINITGTTTITSFGSSAPTGDVKFLTFAGVLTLTHNGTSLIVPGNANISTSAGMRMAVQHEGSGNWRVLWITRNDGEALNVGSVSIASAATTDLGSVRDQYITVTGTTTITSFGSSAPTGVRKRVVFSGILTLTYNATSLMLPGNANITTAAGDSGEFVHEGSGNWRCTDFTKRSIAPGGGGGNWTLTKLTSTNASWSVPAGTVQMIIELWGGGGSGSGRGAGAVPTERGAGGGAGAYGLHVYSGTMDSTLNVTIGAGGTSVTDAAGNAGGNTSVVGTNLGTLTANGGAGGDRGGAGGAAGGAGGSASGSTITMNGQDGAVQFPLTGHFGVGGTSPRGGCGGQANVGTPGDIPGAGGSGENHTGGGSGAGARGEVWIWTR